MAKVVGKTQDMGLLMAATAKDSALDRARLEARLTYEELGQALGCSTKAAWRYCLPRGHRDFRIPPDSVMPRIVERFFPEVQPNDFYEMPVLAAVEDAPASGEAA